MVEVEDDELEEMMMAAHLHVKLKRMIMRC